MEDVLTLSQRSFSKLESEAKERKRIEAMNKAEIQIIEDLDLSAPRYSEVFNQVKAVDKELDITNKSIAKAYQILDTVQNRKPKPIREFSDLAKELIKKHEELIRNKIINLLNNGKTYATLAEMINIEDEVSNCIQDLVNEGFYIETNEEELQRMEKILLHKQKVVPALKLEQ